MTLILFVVISLLVGCTSNESSSSEKDVTLTWLVRSDPVVMKWHEKMIEEFEKENKNIKVKLQVIPTEEYDQRVQTMIASGNIPDVWSSNWGIAGFATYHSLGALLDLSPFVKSDPNVTDGIKSELLDLYTVDGKLYGIPMQSIGSFLFYNKELFDKEGVEYPPVDWDDKSWDWDKFIKVASELTENSGDVSNQTFGVMNNLSANRQTWLFGGDFFNEKAYKTGEVGEPEILTNPLNQKAIQANVDLIHKYKVSPNPSQVEAVSALGDPFMSGRVAMTFTGGWGLWTYQPAEFEWGVAALPYNEGRKVPLYVDPWNISAKTKYPEEAWKFVKFITDPQGGAKSFMETTSAPPAQIELEDEWYAMMSKKLNIPTEDLQKLNDGVSKYGRGADNHLITKFSTIRTTMDQTMTSVYSGKKTVEEGLKEFDKNLRSLDLN